MFPLLNSTTGTTQDTIMININKISDVWFNITNAKK